MKTVKLAGAAREAAVAYAQVADSYNEAIKEITQESQRRIEEVRREAVVRLRRLWLEFCVAAGVDPVESTDNPKYQIDAKYLREHGDVYLLLADSDEGGGGDEPKTIH